MRTIGGVRSSPSRCLPSLLALWVVSVGHLGCGEPATPSPVGPPAIHSSATVATAAPTVATAVPISSAEPGGALRVRGVAAGPHHTCVVTEDGRVACWGRGAHDVLGTGRTYREDYLREEVETKPVRVPGLTQARNVLASGRKSCAWLTTGELRCWGVIIVGGQDFDLVTERAKTPRAVELPPKTARLAVGGGAFFATLEDGSVRAWGAGSNNNLGQLRKLLEREPIPVEGLSDVSDLATRGGHSCAAHGGGFVACWGTIGIRAVSLFEVELDAVELSSSKLSSETASKIVAAAKAASLTSLPLRGITRVAVGMRHGCALGQKGEVWCWGHGDSGQLGHGETPNDLSGPHRVTGLPSGARDIAVGGSSSCALVDNGDVWCWGRDHIEPSKAVATPKKLPNLSDVEQLTLGTAHGCARSGGDLWCWGSASFGQTGLGERDKYLSAPGRPPRRVPMPP